MITVIINVRYQVIMGQKIPLKIDTLERVAYVCKTPRHYKVYTGCSSRRATLTWSLTDWLCLHRPLKLNPGHSHVKPWSVHSTAYVSVPLLLGKCQIDPSNRLPLGVKSVGFKYHFRSLAIMLHHPTVALHQVRLVLAEWLNPSCIPRDLASPLEYAPGQYAHY